MLRRDSHPGDKGFTLLELLVVMAIIFMIASILVPMMRSALLRAHISAVATDAKTLHQAFQKHFLDFNSYPNSVDSPAFDLATFEPLVELGYYRGKIGSRLEDRQADAYDSPDDRGLNQEFWLELTLLYDPTVRFLVADSDNAPLGGGDYFDGIYLFRNGVLTSIDSVRK